MNNFEICPRCIMDTSVPGICFDKNGVCNYCKEHDERNRRAVTDREKEARLKQIVEEIRRKGRDKDYDCILGVSGGLDSTYAAYVAKKIGLRPLAVHLDNGWDSELAVSNIENVLHKLGFDLCTQVIHWNEFRDLQLAYLRASVVDIEMLSDHAILATLYKFAGESKVKYIVSGSNNSTEGNMPQGWIHFKGDLRNIRAIHKKFGTMGIKSFPTMSLSKRLYYTFVRGVSTIPILNYVRYDRGEAMDVLKREVGWKEYGGKHYESIFTRFYQGYILPLKFNIDKRKVHYSNLIRSGQMSRERAIARINEPTYPAAMQEEDRRYVMKKLRLSEDEFGALMDLPRRAHSEYASYASALALVRWCKARIASVRKWLGGT